MRKSNGQARNRHEELKFFSKAAFTQLQGYLANFRRTGCTVLPGKNRAQFGGKFLENVGSCIQANLNTESCGGIGHIAVISIINVRDCYTRRIAENFREVELHTTRVCPGPEALFHGRSEPGLCTAGPSAKVPRILMKHRWVDRLGHVVSYDKVGKGGCEISGIAGCAMPERWS